MDFKVFCSCGFSIVALVFAVLILFIYITKRRKRNIEVIIFTILLISNVLGCFIEFLHVYSMWAHLPYSIMQLFCKLHASFVVFRLYGLMVYVITIRFRSLTKYVNIRNLIYVLLGIISFINIILIFLFDTELLFDKYIYDFHGLGNTICVAIPYFTCGLVLFSLFLKDGAVKQNQMAPLFYSIVILFLSSLAQLIIKLDANFQNYLLTLLIASFYFTTENQDVKLLDELEIKRKDADIANEAQTEFLSNMSHEIRTPMNTIIGFAESLLAEKDLTKEIVQRDMVYIHDSSITLLELINNILDISRIESGREKVSVRDYRFQDMIFEINSLISAKMKNKEVTFNVNIDHGLPRVLKGDSQKIVKVIVNILTCSVNYTNYGKIDLNINKQQRDDGKFVYEVLVANTGHALQEQDFNLSFNDFIKVETENDNTIDGVKLGLMCAKEYADMMGGRIEFKNEVGKGTRYFFYLEQEVVDNTPCGDVFANASDKIEHKLFDLTGKKVLVVDDSKVNVKLAQRLLSPYNLEADTALSGKECLEMVKTKQYDMIFLDHMMPEMDGVTTLKFLKSSGINLPPVIALTANSYNGAKEKYTELGFSNYLAKPISYKELNKIMYEYFYNEDNELIQTNDDNNSSTQNNTNEVIDEEGVEII